jgi:Spy/CpxP family protein refolding chaperone
MKTLSKAAIAATLFIVALQAQPPGPPDPATMVQHRVARLTTLLNLNSSQVTQATTIFTNAQTGITPLMTTLDGYRTSMQTAVKSNTTATIDQLAMSIGAIDGQITAIQSKAHAAFYAILTPDQQTTLNSTPGGFGGPGGPGFGPRGRPGQ